MIDSKEESAKLYSSIICNSESSLNVTFVNFLQFSNVDLPICFINDGISTSFNERIAKRITS